MSVKISNGVSRMLQMVKDNHDVDLYAHKNNTPHLITIYEHYLSTRQHLKCFLGESDSFASPEYQKAFIISEAARMLLREIAPKRIKKRNKK